MQLARLTTLVLGAGLASCGDNHDAPEFPLVDCSKVMAGNCVEIAAGDAAALQTAANSIEANTTIVLAAGTYAMTNQLTLRTNGAHLIGQGIDVTTLDFSGATTQINGIVVIGNDFLVQDITVLDAPK